jgi:hypothetical protein
MPAMRISDVRSSLRQRREKQRKLLTRGERVFARSFAFAPSLFVLGGVSLLVGGKGTRYARRTRLRFAGVIVIARALLVMQRSP